MSADVFPGFSDPRFEEGRPSEESLYWDPEPEEPVVCSCPETDHSIFDSSMIPGMDLMQTMCGVSGFKMNRWHTLGGYEWNSKMYGVHSCHNIATDQLAAGLARTSTSNIS